MKFSFSEIKKIKVLYSQEQIQQVVKKAAARISDQYRPVLAEKVKQGEKFKLILVAVLSGATRYRNDLANEIGRLWAEAGYFGFIEEDEISVSSYPDGEQPSEIRFLLDTKRSIAGANVILVEDIIDRGTTASWVMEILKAKKPDSLDLYVLIDKSPRREKQIAPSHTGFSLDRDLYVLGYGLDLGGRFRDLPFIGYADQRS